MRSILFYVDIYGRHIYQWISEISWISILVSQDSVYTRFNMNLHTEGEEVD